MKELFEYLKLVITARVPAIKTVRMWNDQFSNSNTKRVEKSFRYPACFIEFQTIEIDNRCLGIRDIILTVRFRFGRESYKYERLDTFSFCDDFAAAIQLLAPTNASGLIFTTFQEITTEFDENFSNVESPAIEYRTRYRSLAAYKRKTDIVKANVTPDITIIQT
jgi:hypothetical protein